MKTQACSRILMYLQVGLRVLRNRFAKLRLNIVNLCNGKAQQVYSDSHRLIVDLYQELYNKVFWYPRENHEDIWNKVTSGTESTFSGGILDIVQRRDPITFRSKPMDYMTDDITWWSE